MIQLPVPMLQNTCKLEQGEQQCRYLAESAARPGTFHCLKIVPHLVKVIDGELDAFQRRIRETAKKNTNLPFGNNCEGFGIEPILEPT